MTLPVQLSWKLRSQLRMYAIALLLGAAVGIFVLYPTNEFVYFYEYQPTADTTAGGFAVHQVQRSLRGQTPRKTIFYAIVGIILSIGGAGFYSSMQRRSQRIDQLSAALESDLQTLIAKGESANLEFKSSFRWDLRENKVNRVLEGVIMKTLAGYMNGNGGTLLIGVGDDGTIVGLDHDYKTLKKQDRDGFEQALMTAIATKLGADACQSVQIVFHAADSKEVCRVMVAPMDRPVYVKDGDAPKLYVRTGVLTRELNVQEAVDYTSTRWPR
ncbi:MAG: ATP-binding protein [Candidatus Korobacteraceae bacterium]